MSGRGPGESQCNSWRQCRASSSRRGSIWGTVVCRKSTMFMDGRKAARPLPRNPIIMEVKEGEEGKEVKDEKEVKELKELKEVKEGKEGKEETQRNLVAQGATKKIC